MKKILVLIIVFVNSYIVKANEGYTFYNETTYNWQWVFCEGNTINQIQGGARRVTVQSNKTEYLNTQVNSAEPGFFLRKNDSLTVSLENKVIIEDARTYNNTVGPEATIGILKFVSNISTAIKNAFSYEVKINRTPYTLKGGPEFAGRGVQAYTQLVGKRVGTYCLKLSWELNPSTNKWEWKKFNVGNPGPHPDGYIVEDGSYQWFWANWKFVPNSSLTDGTSAEPQGVSFLQWGKNFYQESQSFVATPKKSIGLDPYGEGKQGGIGDLNQRNFTLIDESDDNNKIILIGNNYKSDLNFQFLETTTLTFFKPSYPANLVAAYYQIPGKGRICHITGGSIKIQFKPKIKILEVDNIEYTIDGINTLKYNSKGEDFICNSPKSEIDFRYPKTIPALLPPGVQGLGYQIKY